MIDKDIPRFNQAMVALVIAAAYATASPGLVAALFIVLALTRFAGPRAGLFTQLYQRVVRPRRAAPVELEPAAPHRFSQLLAVVFLGAATVAFTAGLGPAGWIIAISVFALAALAAVGKICVGCIFYDRVVAR